jgi:hypothetical protein
MTFKEWLSLYKKANFVETRVSLLSYLEQGNVKECKYVENHIKAHDVINAILKRVYKLETV